jgi:hypothetical protein
LPTVMPASCRRSGMDLVSSVSAADSL